MAYVSSTRSSDSYDIEKAHAQENHEREIEKMKSDEEKTLASAKEDYQERLIELKNQAAEDVRKQKENTYDAQGRKFTNMERENLEERRRITNSYKAELSKEQQSSEDKDKVHNEKLEKAIADANERANEQFRGLKKEYTSKLSENRAENAKTEKYYQSELAHEQNKNFKSTDRVIQDTSLNAQKEITQRTKQFNEYVKENHKNSKMALNEKDREILAIKTEKDPLKISPEAKSKIEAAYQQRYGKILAEERRVNEANTDAIKNQSREFEQNVRDSYSGQFNEMSKDLRQRHMIEKRGLVQGYQDLEAFSEQTKKSLEDRQVDLSKRTYQKHANELSLQGERNQERLNDQRSSLIEDKFKEKDDLENKHKAKEREWGYKLNDTRREYEKKIVDMTDQHQREMEQTKFDYDKKLQEQQKTAKRMQEERNKGYESQITLLDSMNKEHGRLLTEHYEEELDKLKRTNARITQAKS